MKEWYILLRRYQGHIEFSNDGREMHRGQFNIVRLMTADEAVKGDWVNPDGSRKWLFDKGDDGIAPAFLFGFDSEDEAIIFADMCVSNIVEDGLWLNQS